MLRTAIDTIETRQEWTAFVDSKVDLPRLAQDSKPCFGTLQDIDGKYCSTVVSQRFYGLNNMVLEHQRIKASQDARLF